VIPVQQLWQNPEMDEAISSFGGFCELLGLTQVRDYLVSRQVQKIPEWGLYQLDEEGQAIQKQLDDRVKVNILISVWSLLIYVGFATTEYKIFLGLFD
jgi:exportin-5